MPIAVVFTLRLLFRGDGNAQYPAIAEELQVEAEGEALFNDGVGVVLLVLLIGIASGTEEFNWSGPAQDFLREAGGGALGTLSHASGQPRR